MDFTRGRVTDSQCLWRDANQLHKHKPIQRKAPTPPPPRIPPFTTQGTFSLSAALRKQQRAAFDPLPRFFPPHLHGDAPALHGREPVAHVAVAAIGRGLGRVGLRQISPHGGRFLWLYTWREEDDTQFSFAQGHGHTHGALFVALGPRRPAGLLAG